MKQILICTDLDRTLLPNGVQPESAQARPLFKRLVSEPFITLAYVSGRDINLLEQAIDDYNLPIPDYLVGDVGTTIFHNDHRNWHASSEWQNIIQKEWQGITVEDLAASLDDFEELELQGPEKQNRFKLSFYTDPNIDISKLQEKVMARLAIYQIRFKLVYSIDELKQVGLFDILPETASKLQAVNYLIKKTGTQPDRTIYAGDSGNDLEVLTSSLKAILVANATDEVRTLASSGSPTNSLYLARGNFMKMNGNYGSGILEGMMHYLPELVSYIKYD